jgi:lipopolysaccharide cholinephosphotransferase
MSAKMKHDMKAILGEDFFKEEEKCDFLISEEQKMMWAMQMDLYMVFSEICEKYGLKYFMMYGGLLGAIRHNGFIPWDDDLDVAMPREDYDKFIKIAPKELSEPYALQCPYTYPSCYITNITLRNSMGTFTPKRFVHLDYNKGIPMDIFPLDYCNPEKLSQDQDMIFEHILICSSRMNLKNPKLTPEEKEKHLQHKTDDPLHDWEMIQKIASNPKYKGSDYLVQTVVLVKRWYGTASPVLRTEWFDSTELHQFESINVRIPSKWNDVLCKLYGVSYMQYPPINERGSINNSLIVDPYTPYQKIKW